MPGWFNRQYWPSGSVDRERNHILNGARIRGQHHQPV
jgi:hypothetical protein